MHGFAARRAAVPALRVVELRACVCGNDHCTWRRVDFNDPWTVELLAELRAAWPGLEVRRLEEDWTQV
jgi:hypothetical protein